ncbi:hypothetical protein BGW80DRAFT_1372312 [Lactifluus volemus]|nr:hypothetical protein BGW80DRAFT_1372312 [Lactifluus volemus]
MSHPGYPTPSHYTTNVAYDEPSSQVSVSYVHLSPSMLASLITASSKSQLPYAYQGNQIIVHQGAGATQNTHDSSIVPGLRQPEYYTPPDHPHEIPNGVSIWHARQPPNVANLFQGLPGPVPPGISAEKELKQLASRYLRDPDSHVDRVRVRCSRCSGKVKVMILLELDEVE